MKRNSIIRVGLSLLLLFGLVGWLLFSESSPINRASAIKATCEWARLAPFPKSAKEVAVEISGGMFTREFQITFRAPENDIQKWLRESPGTKNVAPESQDNGDMLFNVKPGGGAQFAEVVLSKNKKSVRIRTYWS